MPERNVNAENVGHEQVYNKTNSRCLKSSRFQLGNFRSMRLFMVNLNLSSGSTVTRYRQKFLSKQHLVKEELCHGNGHSSNKKRENTNFRMSIPPEFITKAFSGLFTTPLPVFKHIKQNHPVYPILNGQVRC